MEILILVYYSQIHWQNHICKYKQRCNRLYTDSILVKANSHIIYNTEQGRPSMTLCGMTYRHTDVLQPVPVAVCLILYSVYTIQVFTLKKKPASQLSGIPLPSSICRLTLLSTSALNCKACKEGLLHTVSQHSLEYQTANTA